MRSRKVRTKWLAGLICRWTPSRFQFTAKQCAVEFFYELDEPVWILLTARRFREYTPILQLSFHPDTSVGLVSFG